MFRRKLKIKSISVAATGDFLFTLGLGADGKIYMWNSQHCEWMLHKAVAPPQEPANG
jgi:hypothetical protein